MAERIREVYPIGEIAHLWAHQTQQFARCPGGNFSFAATELRSYDTVIAERITHKGNVVFLHLDKHWSRTTNKHQSFARRASYGEYIFHVKDLPYDLHRASYYVGNEPKRERKVIASVHRRNVEHFISQAENAALKCSRAHVYAEWLAQESAAYLMQAAKYAALFGVRIRIPTIDIPALIAAAKLKVQKATAAQYKAYAKAQEARQQRRDKARAIMPEVITYWRRNGRWPDGEVNVYIHLSDVQEFAETNLMRLDGADVVTDLGARVPANIVRRMCPIVLTAMDTIHNAGSSTAAGVVTIDINQKFIGRHVSHYTIDAITADQLTIGCHKFSRQEITMILDTLLQAEIVPADDAAIAAG